MPQPSLRRWLLASVALAGLGLAVRRRQNLAFYLSLWRAQHHAQRYYSRCPHVHSAIPFSHAHRTRLDVYQPAAGRGHPVVVYIYGGSWFSGSRQLYALLGKRLLPENIVVVVPDYTTYPAGGYPRQTQEVAAAIAWTLDNIHAFGGAPDQVFVAAQSAGAQIAGLAVLEPRWLAAHGRSAAELSGFVGISGVYDVPGQVAHVRRRGRLSQYVVRVMGGPHNLWPASPLAHVGPHAPPSLLIHGDADTTVPVEMSIGFHQRLQQSGADSQLRIYAGGGHSGLLFDALARAAAPLFLDVLGFIRQRSTPPRQASAAPAPVQLAAA